MIQLGLSEYVFCLCFCSRGVRSCWRSSLIGPHYRSDKRWHDTQVIRARHFSAMRENGKPSGLGRTAAHGKHMDEKWSRDVHGRKEENVFETKGHLSRKDQKIGSAISLPSYLCVYKISHRSIYRKKAQ